MGVVGPLAISSELREQIETEIVARTLRHLQGSGLLYRGVLYIGLMITPSGPRVIEYNVRFGDPEAQVILPLLDGDWGFVFTQLARGELTPLKWKNMFMACVVLAAPGYPEAPVRGVAIDGDVGYQGPSSYFLHAGTARGPDGQWVTAGGRVMNAVGLGSSLKEAIGAAYKQAKQASWKGMRLRTDIGAKQS
jgi:phosphoribosylamine--glycine ligase